MVLNFWPGIYYHDTIILLGTASVLYTQSHSQFFLFFVVFFWGGGLFVLFLGALHPLLNFIRFCLLAFLSKGRDFDLPASYAYITPKVKMYVRTLHGRSLSSAILPRSIISQDLTSRKTVEEIVMFTFGNPLLVLSSLNRFKTFVRCIFVLGNGGEQLTFLQPECLLY